MTIAAAIQCEPVFGAPQRNLDVAVQLVFQAGLHGAKLIILPELSMSGYVLKNQNDAALHAQTVDGYQTQALHEIARSLNVYISFGYVELSESKLYNSAAVVGPAGVVANVRKNNLRGSDYLWATPGCGQFPVVVTPFGRLGVLICKDVTNEQRKSHPAYDPNLKFYHPGSVDTIALHTSHAVNSTGPDSEWMELAESLRCNIVVGTRSGVEDGVKFNGGSCVIDKTLKIWNESSNFAENKLVGGKLLT